MGEWESERQRERERERERERVKETCEELLAVAANRDCDEDVT